MRRQRRGRLRTPADHAVRPLLATIHDPPSRRSRRKVSVSGGSGDRHPPDDRFCGKVLPGASPSSWRRFFAHSRVVSAGLLPPAPRQGGRFEQRHRADGALKDRPMSRIAVDGSSVPPTTENGRRHFLSCLVWVGVVSLGPLRASAAVAHRAPPDSRLVGIKELVPHTESAVVIGREYLRVAPAERDPGRLAALISSCCGEPVFDSDGEALRRSLARRTRQDFAEGQIVRLHGWMLSVTEARLCGLVALCVEREHGGAVHWRTP